MAKLKENKVMTEAMVNSVVDGVEQMIQARDRMTQQNMRNHSMELLGLAPDVIDQFVVAARIFHPRSIFHNLESTYLRRQWAIHALGAEVIY